MSDRRKGREHSWCAYIGPSQVRVKAWAIETANREQADAFFSGLDRRVADRRVGGEGGVRSCSSSPEFGRRSTDVPPSAPAPEARTLSEAAQRLFVEADGYNERTVLAIVEAEIRTRIDGFTIKPTVEGYEVWRAMCERLGIAIPKGVPHA